MKNILYYTKSRKKYPVSQSVVKKRLNRAQGTHDRVQRQLYAAILKRIISNVKR